MLLTFLFHLLHINKTFPFEDFFHLGNNKKSCSGQDQGYSESEAQGSCHFWSKIAEHSAQCGQVQLSITHNEIGKHIKRVFKKNSLKLNVASHNSARWYTDTDGSLEHSSSRGNQYYKRSSLQKITLVLGGLPLQKN